MKVYKLQNIQNPQPVAETKASPRFRGKSNWNKIGNEVHKKSQFVPKVLTYLGQNDGEILNTVVTAVGTAVVAPIFIAGNPIAKEDKETKWYSAMRQPISAVIALAFQLYVNNVYNDWMARGACTGTIGEAYDLRAMPKAKYLTKIIKLEHPDWNKEQIQAEIVKRQDLAERKVVGEYRVNYRDKHIDFKDLVSKDSLDEAKKDLTKEIKIKYKDELKGKNSKEITNFIDNKIDAKMVEERAIKDIEASIKMEAKSKYKIRELKQNFSSLDDAIKHISEIKPTNEADKKIMNSVLDRLETIKVYEQAQGIKPFDSVKNLGKTYEEVLHNVKIKRLVKSRVSDAAKAFSSLNKWTGIVVSLITLPFSCGLLNWAYPRVMEKVMPKLQPWIHRNDPDWTPEKAKKYGPPEKGVKQGVKDGVNKSARKGEEDDDD